MFFATIINICATCAPDISRRRFFLRRCAAILRCTWREFILRDTGWTRRTMIRRCCRCHGGDELMICSLKDSKNGMIIDVLPVVPWKRVRISNMEMKYDEMTWHCRPFLWKREEIYRNLTLFSLTSAVVVLLWWPWHCSAHVRMVGRPAVRWWPWMDRKASWNESRTREFVASHIKYIYI